MAKVLPLLTLPVVLGYNQNVEKKEPAFLSKIIKAARGIPEEEHAALYELVREFKRNLEERGERWSGFTGIISDEEAEDLLSIVDEEIKKETEE